MSSDGIILRERPEADLLSAFADKVILKFAGAWPPGENEIAREFVTFVTSQNFITLQTLIRVCERFGIRVRQHDLPAELRGYNHSYAGQREIVLSRVQAYSGEEHTLLHELREHIEYGLQLKNCPTAEGPELEKRAEDFASSVRMHAFLENTDGIIDSTQSIQSSVLRFGAIILIIGFVTVCTLSFYFFPHIEDAMIKKGYLDKRNVT